MCLGLSAIWLVSPSRCWPGCGILARVGELFSFPLLRVQQPAKMLANRAVYEIFNGQRQLLAVAAETGAHTRLQLMRKAMPEARVLDVTAAPGSRSFTLIKHAGERITELQGPGVSRPGGSAGPVPPVATPFSTTRNGG
jgi:hypothetical protein